MRYTRLPFETRPLGSPERSFSFDDALRLNGVAQRAGVARGLVFVVGLLVACLLTVYGPLMVHASEGPNAGVRESGAAPRPVPVTRRIRAPV